MSFSGKILDWYHINKRSLPWRKTTDPYKIWLSEVILQQTRVAQGLPYYNEFVNKFPSVKQLAQAGEDQVLRIWQGLGYYSRAKNLHKCAKIISSEFDGNFPKTYKELLQLPGIGPYTAAAIASFCFNEPVAVVDGNVYRVLSRYYGEHTDIASTKGAKVFTALANAVLDPNNADIHNKAIMEFGAPFCTHQNPNCAT